MEPEPIPNLERIVADGRVRHNPSTGEETVDHKSARIKLWVAHNVRCAIYWGGMSFNGYCQLPDGHPDRVIAEAYDDFEHNDPDRRDRRTMPLRADSHIGYDMLTDIDVHGGLTYGPDDDGWVGFDTGHAGDNWDDEEIRRWLEPANREAWLTFREVQILLGADSWPPSRLTRQYKMAYDIDWTMERLEAEVDRLAALLDQRRGLFVTNGAQ